MKFEPAGKYIANMKFEPAGKYTTWDIRLACKDKVTQLAHGLQSYGRQNLRNGRLTNYAVLVSAGFDIFFVATTTAKITNPTPYGEKGTQTCHVRRL